MKKNRINYQSETLIILPHLDDEFAIIPIIKKFAANKNNNIKFVYCAERNSSGPLKTKRRKENIKALSILGFSAKQVIYLNNFFLVDDLNLIASASQIYHFLTDLIEKTNVTQIITLNFEGGHPDHDALALLIQKITTNNEHVRPFYVPAYNYRKTLFFPVSVFRPLVTQKEFFNKEVHNIFIWFDTLKLALIYSSERSAFLKLLPFMLYKVMFSRSIYLASKFDVSTVDWSKSLSLRRYYAQIYDIIHEIQKLNS